ncbi:MAG TPA: hypothetical protein VNN81_07385, partial [Bradyrhizobium sp.]|nr:hypothetical protein [Bradyrhizobium sp.]
TEGVTASLASWGIMLADGLMWTNQSEALDAPAHKATAANRRSLSGSNPAGSISLRQRPESAQSVLFG